MPLSLKTRKRILGTSVGILATGALLSLLGGLLSFIGYFGVGLYDSFWKEKDHPENKTPAAQAEKSDLIKDIGRTKATMRKIRAFEKIQADAENNPIITIGQSQIRVKDIAQELPALRREVKTTVESVQIRLMHGKLSDSDFFTLSKTLNALPASHGEFILPPIADARAKYRYICLKEPFSKAGSGATPSMASATFIANCMKSANESYEETRTTLGYSIILGFMLFLSLGLLTTVCEPRLKRKFLALKDEEEQLVKQQAAQKEADALAARRAEEEKAAREAQEATVLQRRVPVSNRLTIRPATERKGP